MIKKIIIILVIFFGAITFAQSETSWIKKKDKSEKIEKVKKVEKKSTSWIKKKEVKENKKKLKEKIKESKSWITKKSKDKVKDIKEKLKKHKTLAQLPKAELYFAISIDQSENEDARYIYGYINSDKTSENSKRFKFKNNVFYSNSDGIAFFDDNKTTCQIDVLKDEVFGELKGKAIIKCKNKEIFAADINFENNGKIGKGYNIVFKGGRSGKLEFTDTKITTIAKLKDYKTTSAERTLLAKETQETNENLNLKVTGKYFALLIGNSNYEKPEWSSLTSPVNDVSEIGKILKSKYNFEEVLIVKNANRNEMFEAFEKLSQMTNDKDYVLIYYAGHGDIKGNTSYWIPVDAQKKSIRNWINLRDIENYIVDIPAHHLAVMVDSCYFSVSKGNNKITEKQKSKLYQKLLNKRARVVLSSGQNEPVDDTGAGDHSIFGISFINSLKNNDIISFREIGNDIAYAHAGMRQQPYLHLMLNWGHTNGDFVFIANK